VPETCTDEDERQLSHAVDVLVEDQGRAAGEAENLIVDRGFRAIAVLETAIYNADESGRRRVVRALIRIGHPEVVPILRKLAEVDESPSVRAAAAAGVAKLAR
jgi:HEAT repeat protein